MCSSPKSSGAMRKSKVESIFTTMDSKTRSKFVKTANLAQERKELRLARQRAVDNRNSNVQTQYKKDDKVKQKSTFTLFLNSLFKFPV